MMFPPSEIETERLALRRPTVTDAEVLFETYCQDPRVSRYMLWRPHKDVSETREFLQLIRSNWENGEDHRAWLIVRRRDGRLLGMIGATVIAHRVEIGYVLAHAFWGQGYMSEAAAAVCEAALSDPGVRRVWAVCDVENIASARVMEKIGMHYEGVMRSYLVHPNIGPEPRDCRLYARTRTDATP